MKLAVSSCGCTSLHLRSVSHTTTDEITGCKNTLPAPERGARARGVAIERSSRGRTGSIRQSRRGNVAALLHRAVHDITRLYSIKTLDMVPLVAQACGILIGLQLGGLQHKLSFRKFGCWGEAVMSLGKEAFRACLTLALWSCVDAPDPMAPRSMPIPLVAGLVMPGTASATLEWLGEIAACPKAVPEGINASGTVVGWCGGFGTLPHGMLFDPPRLVESFSPTAHYQAHYLFAINDAGNAAGTGYCFTCAPVGRFGYAYRFGSVLNSTTWELLPDGFSGLVSQRALDINNHGDVVGTMNFVHDMWEAPWHSVVWPADGASAIDLGLSNTGTGGGGYEGAGATAIAPNLTGDQMIVVGSDPGGLAWVWRNGTKTVLSGNGIRFPNDVADNGWIVGDNGYTYGAWLVRNGTSVDLGRQCVEPFFPGLDYTSRAMAIAFMGQSPVRTVIVGDCENLPYFWFDDGNGLFQGEFLPVLPGSKGGQGVATDVNDRGQVVGTSNGLATRWQLSLPPLTSPVASMNITCQSTVAPPHCIASAAGSTDDGGVGNLSFSWTNTVGRPLKTGVTAKYLYSKSTTNTFIVTLTTADATGLSHSISRWMNILELSANQPPYAAFTISCVPRVRCTLNASPSTDDGGFSNLTFAWTATGGRNSKSGNPVNYPIAASGLPNTFNVTLTVKDGGGLTSAVTKSVSIP